MVNMRRMRVKKEAKQLHLQLIHKKVEVINMMEKVGLIVIPIHIPHRTARKVKNSTQHILIILQKVDNKNKKKKKE